MQTVLLQKAFQGIWWGWGWGAHSIDYYKYFFVAICRMINEIVQSGLVVAAGRSEWAASFGSSPHLVNDEAKRQDVLKYLYCYLLNHNSAPGKSRPSACSAFTTSYWATDLLHRPKTQYEITNMNASFETQIGEVASITCSKIIHLRQKPNKTH